MRILSINPNLLCGRLLPKLSNKKSNLVKNTAWGVTMLASSFIPTSCYQVYEPTLPSEEIIDTDKKNHVSDDILLPDTVSQPIIQDIKDIHQRINTVFESLGMIKQGKTISDIKYLEFENANNNKFKISDIKQTDEGFEFRGKVNNNGVEEDLFIKLSDGNRYVDRPLICLETSFNKMHNFSMIYQNRWRLGKDRTPERRLFQNRTYKYIDTFNRNEYYPYDSYNVFELRKRDNGIISKEMHEGKSFSKSDEIKNLSVVYY